jgi:16S rRNA (uracil1498-N3)-methyltransferase
MECLFAPDLCIDSTDITLSQEESKHAKVLRLKEGDSLLLSSGNGILAKGNIRQISKDTIQVSILECREMAHELPFSFGIMLPILSSKDRMEFAIEKLTELGIQDIYPFISARSQVQSIDIERLQSKALSAMKQCKRSILPRIHPLQSISDIELVRNSYQTLILGDVKGLTAIPASQQKHSSILICIGPEGGFSDEEQENLRSFTQTLPIRLGNSRLRAETAAIALTSIAAFHYS